MEEEFDDIEGLAEQFKQQVNTGMPTYLDSEELIDVISYFLESLDDENEVYARKALDLALSLYPTDSYLRVLNANFYARQSDYDRADSELDYAEFNLQPTPELYVARVRLAQWRNQPIDAIPLLKKALDMDPEFVDAHVFIALEYVYLSKIDEAVAHALAACRLDEEGSIDEFFFSSILDFGHHPQFILFFEAMTEKMPMAAGWWEALGKTNTYMGRFDKAAEAFKFLIALEEDNYDAYRHLGQVQYAMKQYEEAIQSYEIAQQKDDTGADYFDMIGRCYLGLRNYEAALHSLSLHDFGSFEDEKSIADEELLSFATDELAKAGRFDEARTFLKNQMEKDPHSTHLKMLLINLLSPVRDAQQIEDLCKNVLDSQILDNEYKKQFLYAFVFYCYFNDASELGIEICNLFYDNQVVDEVCFFYIASLYARKMMIEKACFHLERALQLHPADVDMEFLSIDATLGDIPEIKALLDIYVLPAQEF